MKKKAIIFTIDGVRSDAMKIANTPFLDEKAREGASSFSGKCIMPSITMPNHASIFRAVLPEHHKIIDNYDMAPQTEQYPSLFDKVFDSGNSCAAIISYLPMVNAYGHCEKLNFVLHKNLTIGIDHVIPDNYYQVLEQHLLQGADMLLENDIDVAHVYIEAPDIVGHHEGWMSEQYIEAVEQSDKLMKAFIDRLGDSAKNYNFFVTTDHGGHDHSHGSDSVDDTTIWFIGFGDGVKPTALENFSVLDVAPTVARYLGIEQEAHWQGEVLDIYH
jgi:predicted AlkP superfamily pyrophosphatase or phosphodiesterase